ncbi:unnamed protein product [Urochloa humidicola]
MYSSVSAPGCFSRTPLKSPTSARGGAPAISIPVVSGGRSVAVLSELDPHRPRRPDKGSEATVGGLPDDALRGSSPASLPSPSADSSASPRPGAASSPTASAAASSPKP